ncbi:MAG: cell surface protein SprA [Fibrobacterales bacterium]
MGSTSQIEYLKTPERVKPLQNILPKKGILTHPQWGYLKFPAKNLSIDHTVNFEKREMVITASFNNSRNKQKTPLWKSYYRELANYTFEMNDLILKKIWLESLIGQENPSSVGQGDNHFELEIPIKMPQWLKDVGIPKPTIDITGDLNIQLKGVGKKNTRDPLHNSLWPNFDPKFTPNFSVKGSIGKNLSIQINNQEGFQIADQLKIVYQESEPNEFEDNIIQRIEAGNTSLSLEGTRLTGYSENHQGLFGIKGEFKFGDLYLTAIASQEGGSSHKQSLNSEYTDSEFKIQESEFVDGKHFFLSMDDRTEYVTKRVLGQQLSLKTKRNLTIYVSVPRENKSDGRSYYKNLTGYFAHNLQDTKNKYIMKELKKDEFTYDSKTGILSLTRPYRSSRIGAWWEDLSVSDKKLTRPIGGNEGEGSTGVIIFKSTTLIPDLNLLMLRNRYAVGYTGESKNDFQLELIKSSDQSPTNLAALLKDTLGVTLPKENEKDFNGQTGELILPCKVAPPTAQSNSDSLAFYQKACLEPMRHIIPESSANQLYTNSSTLLKKFESYYSFKVKGKRKNTQINLNSGTHSLNSGGCMDIAEGSERLTIKGAGTVLQRGKDYDVLYELGQINLTSDRARDPNTEIEVEYECQPLFQIENKFLLGLRAKYPLESFGNGSLLGATVLYKGQSLKARRPQYDQTPYSSFLWGSNLLLKDSSHIMSKAINVLPFIKTKSPSRWTLEMEIAQSYHNPNTSGDALVEDFEGSSRTIPYSMYRSSWHRASPPLSNDPLNPLDYRYQAREFIWHSNHEKRRGDIFSSIKEKYDQNTRIPILELKIKPINREGKNWGAIMRANSDYASDLSDEYEYIEIVANGSSGQLLIDFGQISEDLSINGYEPNQELNSEQTEGNISPDHDDGLDGLPDELEKRKEWLCYSTCNNSNTITWDAKTNPDPALDNWSEQEYASDPTYQINGTQNNAARTVYDTEDISRDGLLQTTNAFVRYTIDFSDDMVNADNGVQVIEQQGSGQNFWKIYRINLKKYSDVYPMGANLTQILQNAKFTRLTLTGTSSETEVRLARFNIVGSQWETDFLTDIATGDTIKTLQENFTSNGSATTTSFASETEESGGRVFVDVIDNKDDNDIYFPSNNTVTEIEDDDTGAKRREQALIINYSAIEPGQQAFITRKFESQQFDLTNYKSLKMEIHHVDSTLGAFNDPGVRFAIQIGSDPTNKDSYYEWSFRPTPQSCSSDKACHSSNWDDNAFALALNQWPKLKNHPDWSPVIDTSIRYILQDGSYQAADLNYKRQLKILHDAIESSEETTERAEMITLRGNPSISNISWMRIVIMVDDEELSDDPRTVSGEFWINDLRLDGIRDGWGTSARSRIQLEFGDVLTLSTDVTYQNGNFAPLQSNSGSAKKSPAQSSSLMQYNASAQFHLNKFLKDEWKFRIPFMISTSMNVTRPFTQPNSDILLSNDDFLGLSKDFYDHITNQENIYTEDQQDTNYAGPNIGDEEDLRSESQSEGFQTVQLRKQLSVSFAKEYVRHKSLPVELLSQAFLERPTLSYKYVESENFSPTSIDTSYTYSTSAKYKFGQLKASKFRPFSRFKKSKNSWIKSFSKTSFSPWPETFDVTLADFSFNKRLTNNRSVDSPSFTHRETDYGLDLKHSINMRWKMFNFLTASYDLTINRDFNDFHADFAKEALFDSERGGGLFGIGRITSLDTNEHARRFLLKDSLGDYEDITYHDERLSRFNNFDTVLIDPALIDGSDYGILLNEFKRSQNMKLNYSPQFVDFVTTRFILQSQFNHNRNNSNFMDDTTDTYWSLNQTNSFQATATLKLQKLFDFSATKSVSKFLKKMKWSSLRSTWKVNLNTSGEEYTFADLERQGVSAGDYYKYSFGLADGGGWRHPGNIITGDMGKESCEEYSTFANYCNKELFYLQNPSDSSGFRNKDPNQIINKHLLPTPRVGTNKFTQDIDRSLKLNTQLTIPTKMPLQLQARTEWSEKIGFERENPWQTDTTTTWPSYYIYGTLKNIAQSFAPLKKRFSSINLSSGYKYRQTESITAHATSEDAVESKYSFAPLIKATLTTKKKTTFSNAINLSWGQKNSYNKISAYEMNTAIEDTNTYWNQRYIPYVSNEKFRTTNFAFSNDFRVKYEIPTNKGFYLFKWFFRLKNPVILNGTITYSWKRETRTTFDNNSYSPSDSTIGTPQILINNLQGIDNAYYYPARYSDGSVENRTRHWAFLIHPSMSYQFTTRVASLAHVKYSYENISTNDTGQRKQLLEFLIQVTIKFGNR